MRRWGAGLVVLVVGALLGALVAAGVAAADTGAGREGRLRPPPGDTIVGVEGDAANGFTVHHYDGHTLSPPTWSEARAECGEYHSTIDRIRCRVEVRTWYRDLADLRQALDWAVRSGRLDQTGGPVKP